jgi:hypothetical protein
MVTGHRQQELYAFWCAARAEANVAYDAWCDSPGDRFAYAVYRAAEDRSDAAEQALAGTPALALA